MKQVWISDEFVYWYPYWEGGHTLDAESLYRPYEIWERALLLVDRSTDDFDLSDGVANLKRSLNQRLRAIESIYNFKEVSFPDKPRGYLELLAHMGIARPFIIKELLSIRNDIEHNDASPPSIERCKELVDIIWYFLKSTDFLFQNVRDEFFLTNDEINSSYAISIGFDYRAHKRIEISGWFDARMVMHEGGENRILVYAKSVESKMDKDPIRVEKYLSTDLCVTGYFLANTVDYLHLLRGCLQAF